jgi:hypothetical protein
MQGVPLLVRIIDLACTNVGNTGFIAASPNRPTSGNARSDPPRTKNIFEIRRLSRHSLAN